MTTASLASKVAVVTGGTSGIGLAAVHRLVAEGCSVMVAARSGETTLAHLDPAVVGFTPTDVTDDAGVRSMVDKTIRRFGRLDFLFNNAGVEGTVGPMEAWSTEHVDDVLSVNVKGPFLCMKHAAKHMQPGSVIINTSSLLATVPMPLAAPYAASKAALLSLTRSASAELAERKIAVLAICPGVVDTPMIDRVSRLAGAPKEALAEMVCPSRRVTTAARVAEAVTGLLVDSSCFASGSALRVGPETLEAIPT